MSETVESRSKADLYSLSFDRLSRLLGEWGFGNYHARKVWNQLYVNQIGLLEELSGIRADLQDRLLEGFTLAILDPVATKRSTDGLTIKYLFALGDGERIETVLMKHDGRATVCVSTQAGCAMGCVFCATGQMGFRRHLTTGEIVAQVVSVARSIEADYGSLRNVVFMGMGEPLHNFENTMQSIDILTDDRGLAVGPRYITVSTVGLPGAIRKLARDARPFNLAVSLHAADDKGRRALVPVARRWSLDEVMEACRFYVAKRRRRIFFEWALIAGENDTPDQAQALGRLLKGIDSHVNLIPVNPTQDYGGSPSDRETVRAFQATLTEYGIPSTVRQRRGINIQAGCGQLRARAERGSS